MVGSGHGAGDDRVIGRGPVAGSDLAQGNLETFAYFIRDPEGRGNVFPEVQGWEAVAYLPDHAPVRVDNFPGGKMAELETLEELGVVVLVLEEAKLGGGRFGQGYFWQGNFGQDSFGGF